MRRASLVQVSDEARQLMGGCAHRRDRATVVHPDRTYHADCTEVPVGRAIAGGHDGQGLQLLALVLLPDPQEDTRLVERVLEDREQRDAMLEHHHQVAQLRELLYT